MRAPSAALVAAFAAALTCVAGAQAPIVTTVLSNGTTQSRYDMVILADGYQAAEQSRFMLDVATFLNGLFQKAPYAMLASYINVHTVFRASQDSGASHPDANPPIVRTTAYGAHYNTGGTGRCLYIADTSLALADTALAPANESRVLVFVNDSRYGGCAGTFSVSYNGSSMIEVQSHELGHSASSLADEYDYPNGAYTGNEPSQVNISADPLGQKWSHWWGVELVGAFAGAGTWASGMYRPKNDCLMRNLGRTLCPICREKITRSINARVDPIGNPQPTAASVSVPRPNLQTFSFTNDVPAGNNPLVTWKVDGQIQPGATGTTFTIDSTQLAAGSHTVAVEVLDRTTEVRVDTTNAMRHTHSWAVAVVDPNACNLRLTTQAVTPAAAPVGTEFDVAVTVVNDGPGPASNIVLEQWITSSTSAQPGDPFLGSTTIAQLAGGQSVRIVRRVSAPAWLAPRTWIALSRVDRANTVTETVESDNLALSAISVQAGGCGTWLEFRDDDVYPRDHTAIALASGGTAEPTVTARCLPAGSLYVLAIGCSGTAPGTPLGNGITVPINADACTLAGLGNLNTGLLQSFFGVLDAQGVGRATLALPPGLSLPPTALQIAALLVDASGQLLAASNAITCDLQ